MICLSPDGSQLASAAGATVRLWRASNGRFVEALAGAAGAVGTLAFSPDGTLLAAGTTEQTIHVRDVATGEARATIAATSDGLGFLPDGRLATAGDGSAIQLWDPRSGEPQASLGAESEYALEIAISSRGDRLATAEFAHGQAWLWDLSAGRLITRLEDDDLGVSYLTFSPAGDQIAGFAGIDFRLRIWDAHDGRWLNELDPLDDEPVRMAYSPDGRHLACATGDGLIPVWATDTPAPITRLRLEATISWFEWGSTGMVVATDRGPVFLTLTERE